MTTLLHVEVDRDVGGTISKMFTADPSSTVVCKFRDVFDNSDIASLDLSPFVEDIPVTTEVLANLKKARFVYDVIVTTAGGAKSKVQYGFVTIVSSGAF